ncbi:hypothetical protein SAY87_029883 [Trapa incisa]|uniref:Protein kinase domain-containing protein n=1 Tax=Trapa incisa TaxID=236973 RepID=A0AAN7KBT2_9MYRT|nr:hypothetical protein SAY87_029883 [Trapa incisa]
MEAASGLDAVMELLRKNGYPEAESVLPEELADRGDLGSYDFERFLFPMLPPPPPVRITVRPDGGGEGSSGSSSDEQFMSLGSSTTDAFSSSDFVNPYGLPSSPTPDSKASLDRMSQFGTARTYIDFDFELQNDSHPFHEKLHESEQFLGPSEDKFVVNSDTAEELSSSNLFEAEEPNHSLEKKDSSDNGQSQKYTDLSPFESKNLRNISIPEKPAPTGNDLPMKDVAFIEEVEDKTLIMEGLEDQEEEEENYEVFELRIVHRKNRTGFEENKDFPIVLNAVVAGRYHVTEYLGSAAFSKVVRARDLRTGVEVCLKIINNNKDFFDQSLDEIKLLKLVNRHDPADEHHILRLYDYFYHQEHLFIVCELLRANLYEFQKFNLEAGDEAYFTLSRIQVIARQCLDALAYLHGLGIIHCDLKPENILIKCYRKAEIKIIDLGSSCFRSDNLCLYVQSRSYRAPEVILGLPYDEKIDMWSLGCILAELSSGQVLFPNDEVVMILARMVGMLGPIDLKMLMNGQETAKYFTEECELYRINEETGEAEYIIPEESPLEHHLGVSDVGFTDFVRNLLEMDPKRRPSAKEAREHPWFSFRYSGSC